MMRKTSLSYYRHSLVYVCWLALACGGSEGNGGTGGTNQDAGSSPLPDLMAIEVSPPMTSLTIDDLAMPYIVELTATGRFTDGSTRDITGEVTWGVDNPGPGSFVSPGRWQSSNTAGGEIGVQAQVGSIAGSAAITVVLRPVITDSGSPVPDGAPDLFDPTIPVVEGDPERSPRIVYPAHEVMFPINVYRILFQYDQGTGTDVYRIRFVSPHLDMQIYTTADTWLADETTWEYLASTNAGGRVEMTIAGVSTADPSTIYQSEPIDLYFSRSAVEGAIYYWSTSSEGVMKGVLSEPAPTKFYTEAGDDTCVACHTVSRDGTRLAVGYDGEVLQEVTIPGREVLIDANRSYDMGWATFSPDGRQILIADAGGLQLLDADTGDPIGGGTGALDLGGLRVSHPDWSPLGDFVAVAVCASVGNKDVDGCSIGRIPVTGGVFGAVEILVEAVGEDNNFFPKYSPDGRWLAYVYAPAKSKNQPLSELRLIPAAGGTPILLTKATRRVGPLDDVPETGSTMPTWAPSTHPGTQWLAFSSTRDYGKVLVDVTADQLWVAALDLARAEQGEDPTFAAFWLPLQDAGERNHRAFWALDTEQPCTGTVEVCDGYDNDCDGVVDEECAACEDEEVCWDGVDNNCDGLIDERCVS